MEAMNRWRDQLLHEIENTKLLRHARHVQFEGSVILVGEIHVMDHTVTIGILVDPLLHNRLPVFYLRPWDALGFIPHVMLSGMICFLDDEGLVLDRRRPIDVVRESFERVYQTLRAGVTGENHSDFVDEFEVNWQRLPGAITVISSLEPADEVAEVIIGSHKQDNIPPRLVRQAQDIIHIPNARSIPGSWTAERAIYVPLEPGTLLVPPRPDSPFWDLNDVRGLLAHCSTANRERLNHLIQGRIHDHEYLFVGLPRPAGGIALFGIRFDGVERHPLAEQGQAQRLTPMVVQRRDRGYLVQRGGGHTMLEHKHVLLLGCGAVGGHLAFDLARAGLGLLTLVDYDILLEENTYRHVLGKQYWGQNKAQALMYALKAQLPFTKVQAIPLTLELAVNEGHLHWNKYDLIVSALGNPTSELALNEQIRCMEDGPPILFTWLDPLGIGGHALLTGNGGQPGCFECLYTPPDETDVALNNRASFAAPNQTFRRSLAGCDSLHTPYGAIDAAQTAHLASRLAIDTLLGKEHGNHLRSWKGDSEAFIDEGFQLAPRHQLSANELAQLETSYPSSRCRICQEKGAIH
jgi:molybdopterin-synthase adenylyltransferase